ncbi:hypothetical protein [Motilimonas pumila]|uniref:Uncharacterized protein n=1 Tax=Motilimonas pumila TaxID=2303987 RepID=A0A418YBU6_9GAMM|nr:hypothetical protein [Motilimonas pumila]RJG41994.1 hypothetical protein D1Z90_15275 [Motilimonas pumila]
MKTQLTDVATRKPFNQVLARSAQTLLQRNPHAIVLNLTKHDIAPDKNQPFTWIDVNQSGKARSRYATSIAGSIKQLDWLTKVRREPGQKVVVLMNADKLTHRRHIGALCDQLLQSFPQVDILLERCTYGNEPTQNICALHAGLELIKTQGIPLKPTGSSWLKRLRQQYISQQQYQVCHFKLSDL